MVKVKSRRDERNQPGAHKMLFNEGSNDKKREMLRSDTVLKKLRQPALKI
jgi:hypothetical protein